MLNGDGRPQVTPRPYQEEMNGMTLDHVGKGDVEGMLYNPITRTFSLGRDVDVNYLLHAQKPE